MAIIGENGEVRPIESRAMTPFFDSIGTEESYGYAEQIADSAWIRGDVPADAPYVGMLRSLAVAVSQSCAEGGFYYQAKLQTKWQPRKPAEFAGALLAVRGIENEQEIGDYLGVGEDLWDRLTFSERSLLSMHLGADETDIATKTEPDSEIKRWLNLTGVVSGGIMRILRAAALAGYQWGKGDNVEMWKKLEVVAPSGSDSIYEHVWLQPGTSKTVRLKPIEDTVFKRTLSSAQLERAREQAREQAISKLLSQSLVDEAGFASA